MARILVVEDDLAINDLITMNLQVAGYECDSAFDGAEAIAAIDTVNDLCWEHERQGFINGFKIGMRMEQEISQ